MNIIGLGQAEHSGVVHGSIVHIEETSKVIHKVKEEAELMSGATIQSVYVSVNVCVCSVF